MIIKNVAQNCLFFFRNKCGVRTQQENAFCSKTSGFIAACSVFLFYAFDPSLPGLAVSYSRLSAFELFPRHAASTISPPLPAIFSQFPFRARRPTPNQSPELSARLFRAPPGVM